MDMKKPPEKKTITLREHTTFECVHPKSAERITMALVQSGYWVNVVQISDAILIQVYRP